MAPKKKVNSAPAASPIVKEAPAVVEAEVVDSDAGASDADVIREEDEPALAKSTPRDVKKSNRKMSKVIVHCVL